MLEDIAKIRRVVLVCGIVDLRRGIDSQETDSGTKGAESVDYLQYHYNHLGSTTVVTDKKGQTVARFRYGSYGVLLSGIPLGAASYTMGSTGFPQMETACITCVQGIIIQISSVS